MSEVFLLCVKFLSLYLRRDSNLREGIQWPGVDTSVIEIIVKFLIKWRMNGKQFIMI
jgi:hypothetical protein